MNEAILSVLVVERHPMMREALCAAIAEEAGLAVAGEAADGAEALQMADSLQPKVILYSLAEPVAEDLQALSRLRARLPEAAILALADQEAPGLARAALECGACATLSKTSSRRELICTLRQLHSFQAYTKTKNEKEQV